MSAAPVVVAEVDALRAELADARGQISRLTETVVHQAKTLVALAPEPVTSKTIREIFVAYEAARKTEHSWVTIRNRLLPLVRLLGDLPAQELTPKKWAEHRRTRQQELTAWGKPPSSTTLNTELGRAKTMMTWAAQEEQGFVRSNPLFGAKRDKPKKPRRTWLTETQLQQLLEAPYPVVERARLMFRAYVLIAAETGCRFNEVRTLRRSLVVRTGRTGVAEIPDTKNGRPHTAGLTARNLSFLDALPAVPGVDYYFVNENGQLYAKSTMWLWVRLAAEASGLDSVVASGEIRLRPHDLRRTAATNAHNRGATLLEVQDMLNHCNPSITAQYVQRSVGNAVRVALLMMRGARKERCGPVRSPRKRSSDKCEKGLTSG